jgi:hypothetical protein
VILSAAQLIGSPLSIDAALVLHAPLLFEPTGF